MEVRSGERRSRCGPFIHTRTQGRVYMALVPGEVSGSAIVGPWGRDSLWVPADLRHEYPEGRPVRPVHINIY